MQREERSFAVRQRRLTFRRQINSGSDALGQLPVNANCFER